MKNIPSKKWRKLSPKQKKMVKMNAAKLRRKEAEMQVVNRFLASTPFSLC